MKYKIYVDRICILWWKNDNWHRDFGPALQDYDFSISWWKNGKEHREDGPYCEYPNGQKWWAIYGLEYTQEEFNKVIKAGRK